LVGAAVISRLFFLQILNCDFYSALAQGQHNFFSKIQGERGKIYFQDKENNLHPVAVNREARLCFLYLEEVEDREKIAGFLAEKLGFEKEELSEKIESSFQNFLIIKENISEKEAEELEKENLAGLYVTGQKIRDYPYGTFASHILGLRSVLITVNTSTVLLSSLM